MYSDGWAAKGWTSDPRTPLHDGVDYRFWRDEHGDVAGIGIDFEWANDVHYELTGPAFRRLLARLDVDDGQGFHDPLKRVTRYYHTLEEVLRDNDIPFKKTAFR